MQESVIHFTDREADVIQLWLKKKTAYKEIAKALNIKLKTVDTHIQNIFKKLGVNNVTEAVIDLKDGQFSSEEA